MSEPAPTADSAEEFAGSLVSKSFGWVSSEAKNWSEHGVTFCIFWSGWIGKGNLGWILDGTAVLQSSNVTCGDELNMSNSRCSGIPCPCRVEFIRRIPALQGRHSIKLERCTCIADHLSIWERDGRNPAYRYSDALRFQSPRNSSLLLPLKGHK